MGDSYGLSTDFEYYEYELDSWDATESGGGVSAGSATPPSDWPQFRFTRPLSGVLGIKVIEVQIPFTWYIITRENCTFRFTVPGAPAPITNQFVSIPFGVYSPSSIALALGNALNYAATLNGANAGIGVFQVTYNGVPPNHAQLNGIFPQGRITVYHPSQLFLLDFGTGTDDDGSTNPRLSLGFIGGTTLSIPTVTLPPPVSAPPTGYYAVGTYTAQLTGPNYVYLCSSLLGPLCRLYLPSASKVVSQGGLGPQLAKIPVNTSPGGVIFWQDPDPTKYLDVQGLNQLDHFDLYFTLGNSPTPLPLALNGANFSVKLGILTHRTNDVTNLGGTQAQGRVVKRVRDQ